MRAQRADFMQLMADVQNAATLGDKLAQDGKQLVNCLRRQHRGGLIQNQQTGFAEQGANDFHSLHFTNTERVHRPVRLQVKTIGRSFVLNAATDFGQRQRFIQTQPHVLRHAQGIKQTEMLEHHANAQSPGLLRIADVNRLAVKADIALVRLHRAVNDFHQGGFTGAVFAEDGVNLTRHHLQ